MLVEIPLQKGLGQKFCQPSGTGIDLGLFNLGDLSKPSGEDVFPLVIFAETCLPSLPMDILAILPQIHSPTCRLLKLYCRRTMGDPFKVRVIKQILWIDEVCYELHEIYGIGNSAEAFGDNDSGKECVICMTEPNDTAVLPCRQMCMCSERAKAWRPQSNKCPIMMLAHRGAHGDQDQ